MRKLKTKTKKKPANGKKPPKVTVMSPAYDPKECTLDEWLDIYIKHNRTKLPTHFTKLTPKKRSFLVVFYRSNANVAVACRGRDISRRTFYDWYEEDESFKTIIDEVRENRIDLAESKLQGNINAGREASIIFFLKTIGRERGYIERTDVSIQGHLVRAYKAIDHVSPEDLRRVAMMKLPAPIKIKEDEK